MGKKRVFEVWPNLLLWAHIYLDAFVNQGLLSCKIIVSQDPIKFAGFLRKLKEDQNKMKCDYDKPMISDEFHIYNTSNLKCAYMSVERPMVK